MGGYVILSEKFVKKVLENINASFQWDGALDYVDGLIKTGKPILCPSFYAADSIGASFYSEASLLTADFSSISIGEITFSVYKNAPNTVEVVGA